MSTQDSISEMLTYIRNGQRSRKNKIHMYSSKIRKNISTLLKQEGFIEEFNIKCEKIPILEIVLKYFQKKPIIETIKRISKPSLRIYKSKYSLSRTKSSIGVSIISTSKGIMTDRKARKLGIGGEVLFYIN